tara:strand:+ start:479 stop:997 length:519 start_codon:yes stop_codon:yes gene_type:complete
MPCIYKITVAGEIYIGATNRCLKDRMWEHKANIKNLTKNTKLYNAIRLNKGVYSSTIIYTLKEDDNKFMKEREYINNLCPTLNMNRPHLASTDVNERKQYKKQYDVTNAEKIKQYSKNMYPIRKAYFQSRSKIKIKCECGSTVSKGNILQHKKTKKHQLFITERSLINPLLG